MAVIRCENGHFFDGAKYEECPHCKNPLPKNRQGLADAMTVAQWSMPSIENRAGVNKRHIEMQLGRNKQDEKTVGIFKTAQGIDPVVGWLVATGGKEKGRDYRLHTGRNFIGRGINMDIALVDDERISRENHCSIVFEPNKAKFLLVTGESEGVEVNGSGVMGSRELLGEEEIQIGASKFVFIPYCREDRKW
ncbi:FHA domain-containing protein [Christensenellaceae bacterium OttesenSCG-928-M15]|nr:FHA domain-containing protein [Christensenellaceae bacterium OttesenSCG-928-M15]